MGADAPLLSHRGISREAYLKIAAREEQEILAEMEPDAELALRREAVLTAVVAAEDISPVRGGAARGDRARPPSARGSSRRSCSEDLRARGRLEEVREDLAARKAVELIADAGQADPGRAGAGARAAVDARAGAGAQTGRAARPVVDADRSEIGQLAF